MQLDLAPELQAFLKVQADGYSMPVERYCAVVLEYVAAIDTGYDLITKTARVRNLNAGLSQKN